MNTVTASSYCILLNIIKMSDTVNDRKNSEQYKKYVYNSNGNETCVFYPSALEQPLDDVPWRLVNMSCKSIDSKLVLILLTNHGFREVRYNIRIVNVVVL